jgi:hypothetical protein
MKLLTPLRRGAVVAVIASGLALFASALQGVASMDTSLEVAASRATPPHALVQETAGPYDCPDRERERRAREPV